MSERSDLATPSPTLKISEWVDYKEGDEFPDSSQVSTTNSMQFIRALNRPLNTPNGKQTQFVALWYHHGHPLMGRVWNEENQIRASFANNEREFTGRTVGLLQILVQMPSPTTGFTYDWKPFKSVAKIGNKEWHPVHISFVAPCVLLLDNREVLGGANLKEESAQTSVNGKVVKLLGNDIQSFPILCRKMPFCSLYHLIPPPVTLYPLTTFKLNLAAGNDCPNDEEHIFDFECSGYTMVCDREPYTIKELKELKTSRRETSFRQNKKTADPEANFEDESSDDWTDESSEVSTKDESEDEKGNQLYVGAQYLPRFHGYLRVTTNKQKDQFVFYGVTDHEKQSNRIVWKIEVPLVPSDVFCYKAFLESNILVVDTVDLGPLGKQLNGVQLSEIVVLEFAHKNYLSLLLNIIEIRSVKRYFDGIRLATAHLPITKFWGPEQEKYQLSRHDE
ncbi:hypothetical protein M3Y96_01152100 [Aphelenchoides besseyi]|nr:hypothetical protein M3Y96_01152100 [Aphelenchoides besseyi]